MLWVIPFVVAVAVEICFFVFSDKWVTVKEKVLESGLWALTFEDDNYSEEDDYFDTDC